MKCELCGKEPGVIYILPLKQANGSLVTISCEKCVKTSGAFCPRHNRVDQGFIDGSTACLSCVEEWVDQEKSRASDILAELTRKLSDGEMAQLREAAQISSAFTGQTIEISILRFIATKAVRTGNEIDKVVSFTIDAGVEEILWK